MKNFVKENIEGFYDQDSGAIFDGFSFTSCSFDDCGISITRNPFKRTKVCNVNLVDCSVKSCTVEAAILDNVLVDGLKTSGLLQFWGALFSRVTIRGKIGRVMFSPVIQPGLSSPGEQAAFDRQREQFYSNVDWALDIRGGDFEECEIQGLPAHLIRHDSETQVAVYREILLNGDWRSVDLSGTHWATSIDLMLERGDPSCVFVAGKRNKNFRSLNAGLQRLRAAGFAE